MPTYDNGIDRYPYFTYNQDNINPPQLIVYARDGRAGIGGREAAATTWLSIWQYLQGMTGPLGQNLQPARPLDQRDHQTLAKLGERASFSFRCPKVGI
jgi:hypothetical protein